MTRAARDGDVLTLELRVALVPDATFVTSVTPDFRQVEADPAVVSLEGREVFFGAATLLRGRRRPLTLPALAGGNRQRRAGRLP